MQPDHSVWSDCRWNGHIGNILTYMPCDIRVQPVPTTTYPAVKCSVFYKQGEGHSISLRKVFLCVYVILHNHMSIYFQYVLFDKWHHSLAVLALVWRSHEIGNQFVIELFLLDGMPCLVMNMKHTGVQGVASMIAIFGQQAAQWQI